MVSFKKLALLSLSIDSIVAYGPNNCVTHFGPVSVKNPKTRSTTETRTVTFVEKVTHCKTVTPNPKTITVQKTKFVTSITTIPPQTKTRTKTVFSSSTTVTATTTESTTVTIPSTTTLPATEPETTTITTPWGFVPISAGANPGGNAGANRRSPNEEVERGKGRFPQSVDCTKTVTKTKTRTTTTTLPGKTVTLPPKKTSVIRYTTSTTTSTTHAPNVFKTVTAKTHTTITSTEIEERTRTISTTISFPGEATTTVTVVAACSTDNLLSQANGGHDISSIRYNGVQSQQFAADTAYDCCAACFTTYADVCVGSNWSAGTCEIESKPGVCAAEGFPGHTYLTNPGVGGTGSRSTLSNGPCGQWTNGGDIEPA